MKNLLLSASFGTVLLASTLGAQAQLLAEKFYFKADAGAAWLMDADMKQFFGSDTPDTKVRFDVGPRVGVGAGYNFTDWCSAEAELGFTANSIRDIRGGFYDADAVLGQMPFLLNLRFQWPNNSRFTPYIGGGAGGSAMFLDIDHLEGEGVHVWGTGSDVVFAYQAFAGIKYRITDSISLGVEYRFFGCTDPSFDSDDDSDFGGGSGIDLGKLQGQAVSIGVTLKF